MSPRGNNSVLALAQKTCDFASGKDYREVTRQHQPERVVGIKTVGTLSAVGTGKFKGLDIIDYEWLIGVMGAEGVPDGDWYE